MFLEVWIKSIITEAAIDNPSSRKLMEKLWFKRLDETKLVKYTLLDTKVEDYKYELTNEKFLWQRQGQIANTLNGKKIQDYNW